MDLTILGFSTGELDVTLGGQNDPDDVIPPVPSKPHAKPGDIWILGNHRIGCGDSRRRALRAATSGLSVRRNKASRSW